MRQSTEPYRALQPGDEVVIVVSRFTNSMLAEWLRRHPKLSRFAFIEQAIREKIDREMLYEKGNLQRMEADNVS